MTEALACNFLDPVAALQCNQNSSEPAMVLDGELELRKGVGVRLPQCRSELLGIHVIVISAAILQDAFERV